MNRPIIRLYGLVALLFALLVGFTSRWTIFEATSLRENPENKRGLLEQERIERGPILAADGTVLARSVRGPQGVYQRTYPTGEEFASAIGYHYLEPDLGSTGLELFRNKELNGQSGTNLQSVLDQLQGKEPRGDKVITTLDPSAQRVARDALGEHDGAVVALDPQTGAVTVMASTPSYDPNVLRSPASKLKQEHEMSAVPPSKSEVNRATQFGYAPGSTFKIVTATAAIDTGAYTPDSTVSGADNILVSGKLLQNDNGESFGADHAHATRSRTRSTPSGRRSPNASASATLRTLHGSLRLRPQAAARSTGRRDVAERRRYPGEHVAPSSPLVDVGRMGIGQDKLAVTPLQMAEVAAAVANRRPADGART